MNNIQSKSSHSSKKFQKSHVFYSFQHVLRIFFLYFVVKAGGQILRIYNLCLFNKRIDRLSSNIRENHIRNAIDADGTIYAT